MTLAFQHVSGLATGRATVSLTRLDPTHGNTLAAYRAMDSPRYPTQAQVRALNAAAELGPPQRETLTEGKIQVDLPVNSLVVLEVGR